MTFEVIDGGPLTTVQDLGRPGYGAYGVPEGGALDRAAHARANRLLENPPGVPTLEFTLVGPRLRWGGRLPVYCALVGDDEAVRLVKPGTILDCGTLRERVRGYLAVPAGFAARELLGSGSTCVVGGFGGLAGRALRRGDRLDQRRQSGRGWGWSPAEPPAPISPRPNPALLRVVPGPAAGAGLAALLGAQWTVVEGDRAGLRLAGPPISLPSLHRSAPLVAGCVEVTGGGSPLVLLREHPTVGGYPVPAVVREADLDLAAQLGPGAAVRFVA